MKREGEKLRDREREIERIENKRFKKLRNCTEREKRNKEREREIE